MPQLLSDLKVFECLNQHKIFVNLNDPEGDLKCETCGLPLAQVKHCGECGSTGEVPAVNGQPSEGYKPCPKCHEEKP